MNKHQFKQLGRRISDEDERDRQLALKAEVERVFANPFFCECEGKPRFYLTAYALTRHWGGPEEGGWWYDRYTYVESYSHRIKRRDARRRGRDLWLKHAGIIEGDVSSVLGGTALVILPEVTRGEYATKGKPHYE
jgi:hypothetical protein